ncbi:MAG: hypothetical protein ACRDSG_04510, partial [Pseudonocardiaceae bacterium]
PVLSEAARAALVSSSAHVGLSGRGRRATREPGLLFRVLMSFEGAGLLTVRGHALLEWAQEEGSDQPDEP